MTRQTWMSLGREMSNETLTSEITKDVLEKLFIWNYGLCGQKELDTASVWIYSEFSGETQTQPWCDRG